eukprot:TRINITY_DN950_c0_g1_i2.p1 TRINITY_DN950_c0_g1~~TRINITY_DN950_c0_g1_i2.p1  ORF type:complete len:582 (+),score=143.33 TRINITY_DN950_c0_g1_i2:34-1746(+)
MRTLRSSGNNSVSAAIALAVVVLTICFCVHGGNAQGFLSEPRVDMEVRHIAPDFEPSTTDGIAPEGWRRAAKLSDDEMVTLTFAMEYEDTVFSYIEDLLWKVSDPRLPTYGDHLTIEEIAEIVRPSDARVNLVLDFINSFANDDRVRVEDLPVTRDFIKVHLPVQTAQQMLHCEFHVFVHETGIQLSRCNSGYSLPMSVANEVAFVGGVTHFPIVRKSHHKKRAPNDGLVVDPSLIRGRYDIGDTLGGQSSNNSQAVAQFLGQYYSQGDLDEFFDLFFSPSRGDAPVVVGPNNGAAGTEASLDIEYIMSIGAKVATQFWSNEEPSSNQEPFLDWMYAVNNATDAPLLFSVSYGDNENSRSYAYCQRVNAEFIKAGLRGISILFAAGDDGVGNGGICKKFVPNYPTSSPYVTSVGGTQLGLLESGEESVWPDGGGGFSNYFPRPSWQDDAVTSYIQNQASSLPDQKYWNATGRAYPDVSALASGFIIVINRVPLPGVGGTSCATPTFSGVISLLNDLRLSQGKSSLGFLNYWLYQNGASNPQIFNDITSGSNPGCGTNGFQAAKGWDPAVQ